jgi:hypothetical protein
MVPAGLRCHQAAYSRRKMTDAWADAAVIIAILGAIVIVTIWKN